MRKIAAMAACGWLIACLAGCKSPAVAGQPLTTSPEEPQWVSTGASAFPEDARKALYGVGIAAGNRFPDDPFMLRNAAATNGRAKIAGQLQALVAVVFKDYTAAAFAPGMKPGDMQNLTENVQQSVADATLPGAKPVASWKNPQTGDQYVLLKLSLDDVAQQIRDKIIAVEKDKLKMDPAAAHQELDRIIRNAEGRLPKAE